MRNRAAQFFLRHHFVGHRLDHIGTRDEHIAAVLHHEDEVGNRWRIYRTTRAWAHDEADLRNYAACERIALKHLGIAAKRRHTFLNTCAAAVVQANDGRANFHGIVQDLADFHRVRFGQ